MTRDELIAALEAATGPSRELDAAIYVLAGYCLHEQDKLTYSGAQSDTGFDCVCGANSWGATGKQGERLYDQAKPYTASIDAALTLVPEGWTWMASNRATAPRAGRAYIHNGEMIHGGIGHMTRNPLYRGVECTAATPAIALCIAALRARP